MAVMKLTCLLKFAVTVAWDALFLGMRFPLSTAGSSLQPTYKPIRLLQRTLWNYLCNCSFGCRNQNGLVAWHFLCAKIMGLSFLNCHDKNPKHYSYQQFAHYLVAKHSCIPNTFETVIWKTYSTVILFECFNICVYFALPACYLYTLAVHLHM